jgi:fatty-acyl-CoA synthase
MNALSTKAEVSQYEADGLLSLPANTYEALRLTAEKRPDQPALHFFLDGARHQEAFSYTYRALLADVNACANLFYELGLGEGEVVSVLLPNCPAYVLTVLAAQACGVVNPVNPMLELSHLADILNAAQTRIIVTLGPTEEMPIWDKVTALLPLVPTVHTVLTVNLGYYAGQTSVAEPEPIGAVMVLNFHEQLSRQIPDSLTFSCNRSHDDIAAYFHTGGTTGSPKLAQHTHRNELANAAMTYRFLGAEAPKTWLCGLPWFHVNGVVVTGLQTLLHGHILVLATPGGYRNSGLMAHFWQIVAHYKVSFFSAVPTILSLLLTVPVGDADVSSLENVICGAAPLSEKLIQDFENATGLTILEGYGFTEGTCASTANPPNGVRKAGSVGLAFPFHHLRVAVLDDNGGFARFADTEELGILVASGPNVMPGYKEDRHNQTAFVNIGGQRWYNTGDLGRQDADGYFFITGRKKELIIRGGHNIDPKVIEEPLSHHPAVAAVAAVARPDARVGELPVAYVELKPGASATVEELMQFAETHIPERAAVPKKLYILPQLPLTAVGKVFKPELENRQIEDVFSEALAQLPGLESVQIRFDMTKSRRVILHLTGLESVDYRPLVSEALGHFTINYTLTEAN